ncbi:hypothetical protein SGQ83_18590 [Flavobacterium sp. Fl-318]|uniref:Uncharacterized protein n=1 Tax=Flavobacterium cupriresistens TaxID=2893885 RepID=A0ABU4RFI3_9FLAO|nr:MULTISPECIES: hypothetical protein [unclassified Flavobacterium]MDX6191369.1 hypothetical protein [Flavobacterium sp. Fl-318]UFH43135.1 hypothetical protein LNP23_02715 [Flavobacterium sp. F-323]
MIKVIMEGWRDGLEKVSLTKLQNEKLGISLMNSKTNTDRLLDDCSVILEIEDEKLATAFLEEANKIVVNCNIVPK